MITEVNFGGEKEKQMKKEKTVVDAAANSGDIQTRVYRCRKSESKTEFKILNKKRVQDTKRKRVQDIKEHKR